MKRDAVYILKNNIDSEEIRYSVRSVCENFPYRKLIFIGGCPKGIKPDVYIEHAQVGNTKWERTRSSLIKILKDESITEEFFLFNDDFYVLKPQSEEFINFSNGTLEKRVRDLVQKLGHSSAYSNRLALLQNYLCHLKKDTISFAVHMPMLINRYTALGILTTYPKMEMFRSFYGNMAEVPYVSHPDVKIFTKDELPQFDDYLSSCDESFKEGAVGTWIRNRFNKPCKYEIHEVVHDLYDEDGELRQDEFFGGK